MTDIRFSSGDYYFSYRVAGVCVRDGKILLQKPDKDSGYALPGGHSAFGETNEQTLVREFGEEIGAEISVGGLRWVAEIFFPVGDKKVHQICLYYNLEILKGIPDGNVFASSEPANEKYGKLYFYWIPISQLGSIEVYPTNVASLLADESGDVKHFVYREE